MKNQSFYVFVYTLETLFTMSFGNISNFKHYLLILYGVLAIFRPKLSV